MEFCGVCGAQVRIMAMRGEGVCSELCRKRRDGELPLEEESAA